MPRADVPEFKRPVAATLSVVDPNKASEDLPTGWSKVLNPAGQYYYLHVETRQTLWEKPTEEVASRLAAEWQQKTSAATLDVNEIIERAKREAEQAAKEAEAATAAFHGVGGGGKEKEEDRRKKKERAKEKQVASLFGQIVVGVMSKHKDHLDGETFKKRAKEVRAPSSHPRRRTWLTVRRAEIRPLSCSSTRRRSRRTIRPRSTSRSRQKRKPKSRAS
jgi:hypothetical protein